MKPIIGARCLGDNADRGQRALIGPELYREDVISAEIKIGAIWYSQVILFRGRKQSSTPANLLLAVSICAVPVSGHSMPRRTRIGE